jgi:hypothetical protein
MPSELIAHVPTGFSADKIREQLARRLDSPTDLINAVPHSLGRRQDVEP